MEREGHRPATGADDPDRVNVLLLSGATSATFAPLAELERATPATLCVVVSAVSIADDLAVFRRYEWLDYRKQEKERLSALAEWLHRPGNSLPVWLTMGTEHPGRIRLPIGPGFLWGVITLVAAGLAFAALLELLESLYQPYSGPSAWGVATTLGGALAGAAGAAVLRGRAVTAPVFSALYLAAVAGVVSYGAAVGADFGFYVDITVFALLFFANLRSLRDWLLARPLPWHNYPTLAPQPIYRFLARQLVVTLGSAIAASVIVASSGALNR
jgi:hypothetical protein